MIECGRGEAAGQHVFPLLVFQPLSPLRHRDANLLRRLGVAGWVGGEDSEFYLGAGGEAGEGGFAFGDLRGWFGFVHVPAETQRRRGFWIQEFLWPLRPNPSFRWVCVGFRLRPWT